MKKIKSFCINFIISIFTWLVFVFVLAEPDPIKWSITSRVFFVIVTFAFMFSSEIKNE